MGGPGPPTRRKGDHGGCEKPSANQRDRGECEGLPVRSPLLIADQFSPPGVR